MFVSVEKAVVMRNTRHLKNFNSRIGCFFFKICCVILCNCQFTGSLGARITELKQKVIAENPRRYSLAVPRKSFFKNFKAFH